MCSLSSSSAGAGYYYTKNKSDGSYPSDNGYTDPTANNDPTNNNDSEQIAVDPCDQPAESRSCDNYNVGYVQGEKYVCPQNYTVLDGYSPGGLKGAVCYMNNGKYGTPTTCKTSADEGCSPTSYEIPCYGKWPCSKYKCNHYYNEWYVLTAMPASEVCGS